VTLGPRLRIVVAALLVAGVLAGSAVLAPSFLSTDDDELDRDATRAATVQRVNEVRTGQGRAALAATPRLDEIARNRSQGGDAQADCEAIIMTATVEDPSADETRLASQLVDGLTENNEARARLLQRDVEEIGVGFTTRDGAVDAVIVLC
jgi:uncharacterized protein YkwD